MRRQRVFAGIICPFTCLVYRSNQDEFIELANPDLSLIKSLFESKKTLFWLDISGEPPERVAPLLRETFGFHHLAVEDALCDENLAKIDDWEEYIYIMIRTFSFDRQLDEFAIDVTTKLDIFKGHHYLITHHAHQLAAIDREWETCVKDARHTSLGSGRLLYHILDTIADDYMVAMDKLDDRIDAIEREIFSAARPATLQRIFAVKRAVLRIRRTLSPQRDVMNKLARENYAAIDPKQRIYYRDVYDHLVRLYEMNETLRDLISGAMDMYVSIISKKERMGVFRTVDGLSVNARTDRLAKIESCLKTMLTK